MGHAVIAMRLTNGLLISTALHASVLLIGDAPRQTERRDIADQGLEVVLVNAKSDAIPTNAQAIAQVNLAGGGEAAEAMARSPDRPNPVKQAGETQANTATGGGTPRDVSPKPTPALAQLRAQELQLLSTLKQRLIATPLLTRADVASPLANDLTGVDNARAERLQMLDHIAKLENAILESNQRPKRRFVSPATKSAVYAKYFDDMRERIEQRGTQSFPVLNGERLYGNLIMAITVNRDGRVLSAEVLQPSPVAALNRHATALVTAMQFVTFDPALAKVADELTVVTQFNFLKDQTVSATLQAPR